MTVAAALAPTRVSNSVARDGWLDMTCTASSAPLVNARPIRNAAPP